LGQCYLNAELPRQEVGQTLKRGGRRDLSEVLNGVLRNAKGLSGKKSCLHTFSKKGLTHQNVSEVKEKMKWGNLEGEMTPHQWETGVKSLWYSDSGGDFGGAFEMANLSLSIL